MSSWELWEVNCEIVTYLYLCTGFPAYWEIQKTQNRVEVTGTMKANMTEN